MKEVLRVGILVGSFPDAGAECRLCVGGGDGGAVNRTLSFGDTFFLMASERLAPPDHLHLNNQNSSIRNHQSIPLAAIGLIPLNLRPKSLRGPEGHQNKDGESVYPRAAPALDRPLALGLLQPLATRSLLRKRLRGQGASTLVKHQNRVKVNGGNATRLPLPGCA